MSLHKITFDENIKRVESLCKIYTSLKIDNKSDSSKEYKFTDILRAAQVFLHSSFEEYFRNIIIDWLIYKGNEDSLKAVNLPEDAGERSKKYTLVELRKYGNKTVNELFQLSIQESMSRATFNSYSEIKAWMNKIRLSSDTFNQESILDKAIHRRHKIVHEADLTQEKTDDAKQRLTKIQPSDISQWKKAYVALVEVIERQIVIWEEEKDATTNI